MEYDHRITGQVIGRLRVERGLSQDELSRKAGLARSHLTMLENGAKSARVETLWKIAEALDMRLSQVFMQIERELYEEPCSGGY